MVMNKKLQINIIKKMLKKQGIEPDLVDVEARVDSTLNLSENARIIKEDAKLLVNQGIIKPETQSVKKLERFLRAVEIFEKKSLKKQIMDSRKQAKRSFEKSKEGCKSK